MTQSDTLKPFSGLHVGIIMDGNGRWARNRRLPRLAGHRAGARAVRRTVEASPDLGIGTLTLYAFSSDNWQRPATEVSSLMRLFRTYLRKETERCVRNGVRIEMIGRRDRVPPSVRRLMHAAEHATTSGATLRLRVAIDYSGRDVILQAARHLGGGDEIDRDDFARALAGPAAKEPSPDLDLLIRTGGERRLSDFQLWEAAYAELLFLPVLWPDFSPAELEAAVRSSAAGSAVSAAFPTPPRVDRSVRRPAGGLPGRGGGSHHRNFLERTMRLVSFGAKHDERPGVLSGDSILDLSALSRDLAGSWRSLLADDALEEIRSVAGKDRQGAAWIPVGEVRLGPPIPDPGKIICLGRNYVDHATEQDRKVPASPLLFSKAPTALAGPVDDVRIPPGITHVDYEAEMAFVIGRRGRNISEERAMAHVAGYMAFNDVTARKLQREEGQWFRGKSLDTFAPCGPALVTADEIADPHALDITLSLNGERRQSSNTRNLHFRVGFLVSYLSQTMTLEPGDIVSTGTPGGVGVFSDPKVFLRDGDEIVTRVEGLGELRNRVREDPPG